MATKLVSKKKTAAKNITYIAILLDSSGSMSWFQNEVNDYYKKFIQDLRDESKKNLQEVYVSVYSFSDNVTNLTKGYIPLDEVEDLEYFPNGGTALIPAIGQALIDTEHVSKPNQNIAFLVVGVSDGYNNVWHSWNKASIAKLIDGKLKQGNITLAINVPEGGRQTMVDHGVGLDYLREWKVGKAGIAQTMAANTVGLSNYMATRSIGGQSVKSFYEVDVDLQALKPSEVKKECSDITNSVKVYDVKEESIIQDFYEKKTKKPYQTGKAYYLLMKKELIQATKEVILEDKKTNKFYGGTDARDLIGLKNGADCRVTPFNVSAYNVFVQSTSNNRKLPRGTKLLVLIN